MSSEINEYTETKDYMKFYNTGLDYWLSDSRNHITFLDKLPVDYYDLNFHPMKGFYLSKIDKYKLPSKIYGDTRSLSEKFVKTHEMRDGRSTGVLLHGNKGSGKTLQAYDLCRYAVEQKNLPVISVNAAYAGKDFNEFIGSIPNAAVIFFDEFEKKYSDSDKQIEFLSLLDGPHSSNKLFCFTINEINKMNNFLMNRPGRIFYSIGYKGLEPNFIYEYAADNLVNKDHCDSFKIYGYIYGENMTFDMLKAIVEEMNYYDVGIKEAIRYLNVQLTPRSAFHQYQIEKIDWYESIYPFNDDDYDYSSKKAFEKYIGFDLKNYELTGEKYMSVNEDFSVNVKMKKDILNELMEEKRKVEDEYRKKGNSDRETKEKYIAYNLISYVTNFSLEFEENNLIDVSSDGLYYKYRSEFGDEITLKREEKASSKTTYDYLL